MTDFRSMYDSKFLYAFDLKGRDVTATIASVKKIKIKNADKTENKPVVYFKESKEDPPRGLVLCKTNARTIAAMYGNEIEGWIGKRITLFPTMVDAFGKPTEAIRIKPMMPSKSAKAGEFAEPETLDGPEAPEHAGAREPGEEG